MASRLGCSQGPSSHRSLATRAMRLCRRFRRGGFFLSRPYAGLVSCIQDSGRCRWFELSSSKMLLGSDSCQDLLNWVSARCETSKSLVERYRTTESSPRDTRKSTRHPKVSSRDTAPREVHPEMQENRRDIQKSRRAACRFLSLCTVGA